MNRAFCGHAQWWSVHGDSGRDCDQSQLVPFVRRSGKGRRTERADSRPARRRDPPAQRHAGDLLRLRRPGRLVNTTDYSQGTGCVIRAYASDPHGNRTSLGKSSTGTSSCGAPTTVQSSQYDFVDRRTAAGIATPTDSVTYDLLDRATSMPALAMPSGEAATMSYYDSGGVRSITTATRQTVYNRDAAGRRLNDANTFGGTSVTTARHYVDGSGDPGGQSRGVLPPSTPMGSEGCSAQKSASTPVRRIDGSDPDGISFRPFFRRPPRRSAH